jgi:hypothetical protein
MLGLQLFSLGDPKALAYLQTNAKKDGRLVIVMLRILQRDLARSRPVQNRSIEKWTKVLPEKPFKGGFGLAFRFSEEELERVFELRQKFEKPISEEEMTEFRKNNRDAQWGSRLRG